MEPSGKLIAVVDDDLAVRESLVFLLNTAGHSACSFASAEELFRNCDLSRVARLILDYNLPQVTGLELAASLRQQSWRFPILLVTGSSPSNLAAQAAQAGIWKVLEKPPSEQDIMAFVHLGDGGASDAYSD